MHSAQKGFTLAELLIALALLGVIAAFTIPKVLNASTSNETAAKIREAVAAVEGAWYDRKTRNTIIPGQTLWSSIATSFNGINQDSATAPVDPGTTVLPDVGGAAHPCRSAVFAAGGQNGAGWVQFANGVIITGLASGAAISPLTSQPPFAGRNNTMICIDVNGSNSPNTVGSDIFAGNFNQFGGFTAAAVTQEGKSFNWGNASTAIRAANGGAIAAPWNNPLSAAGSQMNN